jgi:drug/metabolite transporter (DMT)-like permease
MNHGKPANLALEVAWLLVLALLWGSSYLFIKIAVSDIPPITLIAFRVSVAAAILIGVMACRGEHFPRDGKTWAMLFIQSIFNAIAAWTILAWGQQYVDSGLASVLNSTSPIFVFFITLLFTRHEAVSGLKLAGACLGVFGVVLIVGVDALHGLGDHIAGQLAALCGALLYACAAIYGKNFNHLSASVVSAGTMIWASLFLVPLSLIVDQPWKLTPSHQSMLAALALGVFCTGFALLIYFRLLKTLGSLGVASQAYLRAGVGVMLGAVFLDEKLTLVVGIGLAAAILGVAAINMPTRQR